MHSCELVVPPPVQGAALLFELGTLIIEGRNSKPGSSVKCGGQSAKPSSNRKEADVYVVDRKETENYANADTGRGALPKRPAASIVSVVHLSPAKRNRDQNKDRRDDELKYAMHKKMQYVVESEVGTVPSTSAVSENLSVYEIKARLANVGNAPQRERAPLRGRAEALWRDHTPLCIDVLLAPDCGKCRNPLLLLERWTMSVYYRKANSSNHITSQWLLNAVRSQLHFSQISAWIAKIKEEEIAKVQARVARELSPSERQRKLSRETCNFKKYESNCDHELLLRDNLDKNSGKDSTNNTRKLNVVYILKPPEENYNYVTFQCKPLVHKFPITDIGNDIYLEVQLESLPRIEDIPLVHCACKVNESETRSRRKSKDVTPESCFTEEALAIKLAAACCLADKISNQSTSSIETDESSSPVQSAPFVTDLGVIDADKGSTSGKSRKLPVYSLSNLSEFRYHSLSSNGSTPERPDLNDTLLSISEANVVKTSSETDSDVDFGNAKDDDSYQSQYSCMSNNQVPSNKLISTDYLLVDDRMQTPCRQSGKHRCNCDEESDQGVTKEAKSNHITHKNSDTENCLNHVSSCNKDFIGTVQKVSSNDKEVKEMTKHHRKQKKETNVRQTSNGQASQKSSGTHKDKKSCNSGKKVRTCSSSDNSDGRSSPELVHYNSFYHICHGCFCRRQESPKNCSLTSYFADHSPKDIATASNNWLYMSNNEKHSELTSTTSIPILQASRFDHVNRFGNFRSTVSMHRSRTPREFYSLMQQTNSMSPGIDQKPLYKISNQGHCIPCCEKKDVKILNNNENQTDVHKCYYYSTCESSKRFNSDDDYRPSTKKLISSATQTDDVLCECGNSLIPKCYECIKISNSFITDENSICNNHKSLKTNPVSKAKMKRSNANHNLAAISQSNILLEAIVRPCNSQRVENSKDDAIGVLSENKLATICHDKDIDAHLREKSHGDKVIDFNCDNSVSNILNNCECDKNIVYSNSFNESSCTNNLLSNSISSLNNTDIYENDKLQSDKNNDNNTKTDLSILVENNSLIQRFVSNSPMKKITHKEKPPDLGVKTDFVIKKPKLKKFSPAVDKISKIVSDRNLQKENDKLVGQKTYNNSTNVLSSKTSFLDTNTSNDGVATVIPPSNQIDDNKSNKTHKISSVHLSSDNYNEEEHILYEQGDYGTFGKIETSDGPINDEEFQKKLSKRRGVKRDLLSTESFNPCDGRSSPSSDHSVVPSISEMDKFRWRLDSAASMVFHSRTGLPLTSSPAPLRRGKSCFDYDSSINSVSGIKSALYGLSNADLGTPDPNPVWSPGSSPGSPSHNHTEASVFNYNVTPKVTAPHPLSMSRYNKFRHGTSSGLLGSFEESALNGRLEPAATVPGFTAEIGASGEFCPSHITLPVTVFFYSLGDNTTSSPYLGHINLGRKGYCVPRAGTIQVTLFNPHGTVVKMFVVMYNLEDMPPYSRTFLRQRTLWGGTCLRYLIHLRFLTSKSGKVYLHTDIRIIVSRKADLDTAAAHSLSSALVLNGNNNDKADNKNRRRKVETGTFRKRTVSEICDIEKKKLNRSIGCYELSTHCIANGCNDALTKYKKDINQNKQSFPITSFNLPSVMTKELSYELRSFTYGPDNPKYSPR